MTNVAIYGGSFDPPHLGHVMVPTHLLLNDPNIDRVLVVPSYEHVEKRLTPYEDRIAMAQLAFRWLPRVQVSRIEQDIGGPSLSHRLIQALHDRHPDWNMRFVIGTDLMDRWPTWEGADTIAKLAPPLPIGRAGISPVRPDQPTPISPAVSSTVVRDALTNADYEAAERYLPADVLAYIRIHRLYLSEVLKLSVNAA